MIDLIKMINISKSYGHNLILRDISLEIKSGECMGLMGESGSGKSTLGRIIAGIENSSSGEYYVQKNNHIIPLNKGSRELLTQVVFQNAFASVNAHFSIEQVLNEALYFCRKYRGYAEDPAAVIAYNSGNISEYYDFILNDVGLHGINKSQLANTLSGGQLQRLCIARSLMMEPDLLILDEAVSGSDPLIQQDILRLLARIRLEKNITMLFIAHDLSAVYYLCDFMHLLKHGQIVYSNSQLGNMSYDELRTTVSAYL